MMLEPVQMQGSASVRASGHDASWPRPLVLVVEDNDDDFFLLERAFTKLKLSAEVIRCRDGAEAQDYLSGQKLEVGLRPGLLLLDLKLPGLSGFDILKWVRSDPKFKMLVVNVLTSSAEPSDVQKAFELGANAYTVKPMGLTKYDDLVTGVCKFWLELCTLPACQKALG